MKDITICKNCHTAVNSQYCGNCGQKKFSRISRNYIQNEFQETLVQTNRGFFYTIKSLVLNPGRTARDYIDGKRTIHYKPLPLLFLLSTISVFISFKLLDLKEATINVNEDLFGKSSAQTNMVDFISNYSAFIVLFTIPLIALTSYFAFKKYKHNYYEHIIANAYFYSLTTIISIFIFTPLNQHFRSNSIVLGVISLVAILLPFIIYIWFWKGFYPKLRLMTIIKHIAIQFLLTIALMIGIFIIGIIMGFIYAKFTG